ncbi:beta-glucosidase [Maricaulis sp. W15]|uniref:glycoside hydrolase family 3 N-terminal domain-containing protein n=1 Tax=Maricaulis sp. W15 TaxID=1772333 RepID=UPI000948B232|nr:glycoside hydrolase family 3 N-terminal domain-containing protein [Maricaulis sp. W15]OLF81111.1 beta-glucosidase [Maricaulis sp. W15]
MKSSIPVLVAAAALAACQPVASDPDSAVAATLPTAPAEQVAIWSPRVAGLLAEMTLEEKLGQLNQVAGGRSRNLNSRLTPDELDRVRRGEIGSYLHVAGAAPLGALQQVAVEESRLGIPLLFAMDVVHGYRTIFPVPIAMASSWDTDDLVTASRIAADEASAAGLHWTFAPMIDIARDPRWGRIVEGGGSDPYLGARLAVAQVTGFQGDDLTAGNTIMATAKHFGAYGAPIGGRDYGTADLSERSLHEIYLPPFHAASAAGSGSMMTAFNDIAGVPSTANEHLIDDVLRARWGFDGMIVSDWNAVAELINHGVAETRVQAAALALRAGVDMDMTSAVFANDLAAAIEAEPALMADLDRAVGHVLTAKERLGLFDTPMAYHDADREAAMLTETARAEARRIAARSIVLLQNRDGALPLGAGTGRVAVIGALAEDASTQLGSWRARGTPDTGISLLDGLRDEAPAGVDIRYASGADPRSDDLSGLPEAVAEAMAADHVILVVGEDYDLSGEARSRSDLFMPASQRALASAVLDTGRPVTVVLVSGRPLAIPDIAERADAVLASWMLGVEAGPALADIIYGRVSPAGRLPVSFPRTTGQAPFTYSEYPGGRPADPDLSNDSNRFHDLPITPLYSFGHGLSYAAFEYGELQLDRTAVAPGETARLTLAVTNTGDRAGDEVVQLYMRDPVASVARPRLELRGFARVALEAGETRSVTFALEPAQFAIFQSPGVWRIEAGDIELSVGASSADLRQSARLTITGDGVSDRPATAIATGVEVE